MNLSFRKIFFILIWVALILVVGWGVLYFRIPEVEVVDIHRGTIRQTVEETGHVKTAESYDIQAPFEGRVAGLKLSRGQTVQSGQTLMTLQSLGVDSLLEEIGANIDAASADRDNARALLLGAHRDREEARREMEKEGELFRAGAVSRSDYEATEIRFRKLADTIAALEAGLEGAEHRLAALRSRQKGITAEARERVITSPIRGEVLSLPVKNGQVVQSGVVLATVGSPGRMEVYAEILSDEIIRLRVGQPVSITLGTRDDPPIDGRIREIYPQAIEKPSPLGVRQRRVPILVSLDDDGVLRPGYEVNLNICTASRENVLLVPRELVSVDNNGVETVKVVQSERVGVRKIRTGMKNPFSVEVIAGLEEGDRLIREDGASYRDGDRVREAGR